MTINSKFYFDVYVDKRFIRRFNSYVNAERILLKYFKDFGHIEKVKRKKLSTEGKANKTKDFKKCQD